MTTAQELQKRFHACMPLFIALGDEMRLSIIFYNSHLQELA